MPDAGSPEIPLLTLVERVLLLADVPLLAETRSVDLTPLAAAAREVAVARDETVYAAGEVADTLYVVIEGRVRLDRDGRTEEIGRGSAFGAWAIFDGAPRIATATALEPSRLLSIDEDSFIDVMSDHVQVSRSLLRVLAGRLRRAALERTDGKRLLAEETEIG